MSGKHTPGPLFVRQPAKWPFDIEIVDAKGEVVHAERRYAYSTSHKSIEDVMTASGFSLEHVATAVDGNERQLADAYLRTAAPGLLAEVEALYTELADFENDWLGRSTGKGQCRLIRLRALLAKATVRTEQEVQDDYGTRAARARAGA